MAERATIQQVIQVGVEATVSPGVAVPATRRLGSMHLKPKLMVDTTMFRPAGIKFDTVQAMNREWSEFEADGQPTYEEVIVPLNGAATSAVVSQVMDGATPTGAFEHLFMPAASAADTPRTMTIEQGQPGVASGGEQFTHGLFTHFSLVVKRSGVTMKSGGFARKGLTNFTPTPALAIPSSLTPILPSQFSAYLDPTYGAIGTTRLSRLVSAEPGIGGRYMPSWFVDSSQPSFTAFVENPAGVDSTCGITVEADTAGMALLTSLRAGDTRYLRLEATGPVLYNAGTQLALPHLYRWDMAVKIEGVDAWSDEDGIFAIPFTFTPVFDTVAGFAHRIMVRNKVTAL